MHYNSINFYLAHTPTTTFPLFSLPLFVQVVLATATTLCEALKRKPLWLSGVLLPCSTSKCIFLETIIDYEIISWITEEVEGS